MMIQGFLYNIWKLGKLVVLSTDPTYGKMPENTWSALVGMLESSDGCPEDVVRIAAAAGDQELQRSKW